MTTTTIFVLGLVLGILLGVRITMKMVERRVRVLFALRGGPLVGREIAKRLGVSAWESVYPLLYDLERWGLIISQPADPPAFPEQRVYDLVK